MAEFNLYEFWMNLQANHLGLTFTLKEILFSVDIDPSLSKVYGLNMYLQLIDTEVQECFFFYNVISYHMIL